MELGQFSISLSVKDLKTSRSFYEKLGFQVVDLTESNVSPHPYGERWLLMRSGEAAIGLFQGFFDRNTLTFNPADVRSLQRSLMANGVRFEMQADETTSEGPTAAMLFDPDGNPILLDQHTN